MPESHYWRKPFDSDTVQSPKGTVIIIRDRCKGCGFCVEFCPRAALRTSDELSSKGYSLVEVADESKCLGCGLCTVLCPEFAISLEIVATKDREDILRV